MVINISVQDNGGFLRDIILLAQYVTTIGKPIKCHEEVIMSLQPMIPPTKRFDTSPRLGDAQNVSMRSDFFF